jgi:hypothetical protein
VLPTAIPASYLEPSWDVLADFDLDYSDLPRTLGAWMAVRHAELMLAHLAAAPTRWPENAIYCHSCLTAMRSVTLLLQKALRHDEGWSEWYADVQERLAVDPEFRVPEARAQLRPEGRGARDPREPRVRDDEQTSGSGGSRHRSRRTRRMDSQPGGATATSCPLTGEGLKGSATTSTSASRHRQDPQRHLIAS